MRKTLVAEISTTVLSIALGIIGSAATAHAELVLSPEDPSVILALLGGGAAALPFVARGVRARLKNKKRRQPEQHQ